MTSCNHGVPSQIILPANGDHGEMNKDNLLLRCTYLVAVGSECKVPPVLPDFCTCRQCKMSCNSLLLLHTLCPGGSSSSSSSSATASPSPAVRLDGGSPITLDAPIHICGRVDGEPSRGFQGLMSQLMIFDGALVSADVETIYRQLYDTLLANKTAIGQQ